MGMGYLVELLLALADLSREWGGKGKKRAEGEKEPAILG